jgi:DNA polymerase (family 10)
MIVYNSQIADILQQIADILAIKQANEFRVRAYRQAARTIKRQSRSIQEMVEDNEDLTELPGVAEDMADKLKEIAKTGSLQQLEELKEEVPVGLLELLKISGLGPKRVGKLHRELGITSREDLKQALQENELVELEGFGKKTSEKIEHSLKEASEEEQRTLYSVAEEVVAPLADYLNECEAVDNLEVAGSYRRKKETVGDIDIVVSAKSASTVMDHFVKYNDIKESISKGSTKSSVILSNDLRVDLRVVREEEFGFALLYFTGSKAHNIELRDMALDRGWKLNEYGVFEDEKRISKETEKDIYELFELEWIPPALREKRGEIEAAQNSDLPELIKLEEIRGDLQMHTKWSDGQNTIEKMARGCIDKGYEYVVITDHSAYVGVTQGLKEDDVEEYIAAIKEVDNKFSEIEVLAGVEVDILEDGSLDLSYEALEKFDAVTASIHSYFDLTEEDQTERIIKALNNKNVNILAHPTGRIIQRRSSYNYDMQKVFEAACSNKCAIEINAQPNRLDLDDIHAKAAKEQGVRFTVSSDAHSVQELSYVKYGVNQSRRGWLESKDVVNTYDLDRLRKFLQKE